MRVSARNSRRNTQSKTRMNFTAAFVIIILSIFAGYLTTKFVVYPLIGEKDTSMFMKLYDMLKKDELETEEGEPPDTQNSEGEDGKDNRKIIEDGLSIESVDDTEDVDSTEEADVASLESGYCIQFGSFSTRDAAEKLISDLKLSGIEAQIIEKDNTYKVVGALFQAKEEAVSAMERVDKEVYSDIFITER